MSVYDKITVPVPEHGINFHTDRRCKTIRVEYTLKASYDKNKQYSVPKRVCIGHVESKESKVMNPTSNYPKIFPEEWEKITGQTVNPYSVNIGLFALVLALQDKHQLYKMLETAFGKKAAKPIMDFALFLLSEKSNVTTTLCFKMKNVMLFREVPYKSSSYSNLFNKRMTEDQIEIFKQCWLELAKQMGVEEVWLYLDGSNADCKSKGVVIAEPGNAKSGKNVNIVSFTCAVAPNKMPVTYKIYRGSMVDAKALKEIMDELREAGIKVAGVILDRGYCTTDSIQYLQDNHIEYIIMCKSNPAGYKKMEELYGSEIKNNMLYWVWGTDLFAMQKFTQVFDCLAKKDYLTMFYDPVNGAERTSTVLHKLSKELEKNINRLQLGKEPSVDPEFKDWIEYKKNKFGVWQPFLNTEKVQKVVDEKGLYGIISSQEMDPYTVHTLYNCRSVAEVHFHVMKTELGGCVFHSKITQGVYSKFFEAFLASILRWFVQMAVESSGIAIDTNSMIEELMRVEAHSLNDAYFYSHTAQGKMKKFFKVFDQDADKLFNEAVKILNDRADGNLQPPRSKKRGPKKGSHNKKYDEQGNVIETEVKKEKKKRGIPKGYKMGDVNKDGSKRKKPGVPVGFKRGTYNKDGSLRKKPGPKSATASVGN